MPLGACSRSRAGTSPTQIHSQHRHLIHRPRHARRPDSPRRRNTSLIKSHPTARNPSPRPEDRRADCAGPASDTSRHRSPPDRGRQSRRTVTSFTMSNNRTRQSAGSNLLTAKSRRRATPSLPQSAMNACFSIRANPLPPSAPQAPPSLETLSRPAPPSLGAPLRLVPLFAWCPSSLGAPLRLVPLFAWWR